MAAETKIDRRIVKTKEAINKAFLELFTEKDFEHITINDISERANVNRGTVYLHYTDKYDLLDKSIDNHLNALFLSCTPVDINKDRLDLIRELVPVFSYFETHFPFFFSMLTSKKTVLFRERMLQIVSSNVREKLAKQHTHQDMDIALMAHFMASAFVGTIEWWLLNNMPHSPQAMAEQVWRMFEKNGVFPNK